MQEISNIKNEKSEKENIQVKILEEIKVIKLQNDNYFIIDKERRK